MLKLFHHDSVIEPSFLQASPTRHQIDELKAQRCKHLYCKQAENGKEIFHRPPKIIKR